MQLCAGLYHIELRSLPVTESFVKSQHHISHKISSVWDEKRKRNEKKKEGI